jgi:hypothetical protein
MTEWTAVVDWAYPLSPNTATVEEWLEKLAGLSAAVHDEPADDLGPERVRCSATISLEAPSLRRATADAVRLVETATGQKATGVAVLGSREFDRRLAESQFPPLVGYPEIAAKLDVSRQRAREIALTAKGFPVPAVQTKNGPLFIESLVDSFVAGWDRKVGRPSVDAMKSSASHSPAVGS